VPVTQNDMQRRRAAAADLLAWSKAQPVFPGKIDYKALINEGRKY
jgi:hypothetical protein